MSLETDFPREAVTRFELVEPLAGRSLLRVQLETGRTHQIRVHLEAIGHPVVGDPVYGHGARAGARAPVPARVRAVVRASVDRRAGGGASRRFPSTSRGALDAAREPTV